MRERERERERESKNKLTVHNSVRRSVPYGGIIMEDGAIDLTPPAEV